MMQGSKISVSVFQIYFFSARHFCRSTSHCKRMGRGSVSFRNDLQQLPDPHPLTKGDYSSLHPEKLQNVSPSVEDAEARIPYIHQELKNFEDYIKTKITEKKYLKSMYKIKPGEKYNIRKDMKISLEKGLPKPYWKKSFFQELSKRSPPPDMVLKTQKTSPLVNLFKPGSNPNSIGEKKSPIYNIPSRAPDDVYKPKTTLRAVYSASEKDVSNEESSSELMSTVRHEVESMELDEAASRERPGPLLLWSMRVQMKHLHESDPEHWTPYLLSHIFLVSEEKVKKVLESRWFPKDEAEVAEHDRLILQNWKKLSKDERAFSLALAKKAIEKRLDDHKKGVSGLPSLPGEQENKLKNLIFEEPVEARRQGVKAHSSAKLRKQREPPCGRMTDIVQGYKQALGRLQGTSGETTNGAQMTASGTSSSVVRYDRDRNTSDALVSKAGHHRRRPAKQKLVTLEEFLKKKKSSA